MVIETLPGTGVGPDQEEHGLDSRKGRSQHARETRGPGQSKQNGSDNGSARQLARGLGWFSLGLGAVQVAAPGRVASFVGIQDGGASLKVIRLVGLREIASGVGILASHEPANWVRARVGGDVMDLALLGGALSSDETRRGNAGAASVVVAGVTALDVFCSERLRQEADGEADRRSRLTKAITVNRPVEEVYRFWRDFQNLPRFMRHLESVQVIDAERSHWKTQAPAGKSVEWDAEIVKDIPNELISWRSVEGSEVDNSGAVRFMPAPGGHGTEVRVDMRYETPGGALGELVAKLLGESPEQQVEDDLRAFKQVLETGEVVRSDATLGGGRVRQHPAQPQAGTAS
jgi:uncharacterized membrane protein